MKNNKKFNVLLSSAAIVTMLSTMGIPNVLAADRDIRDLKTGEIVVAENEYKNDLSKRNQVLLNWEDYGFELGNKVYTLSDTNEVWKTDKTMESIPEALKDKVQIDLNEELKVESVSAITATVAKAADQQLEIQVNGNKKVTVDELKKAGYAVEFLYNKTFNDDSNEKTKGIVDPSSDALKDGFKYAVKVTPAEGDAITSDWTTVKVINATAPVKVTEQGLDFDLDYITMTDENVKIKATKALNGLGKEVAEENLPTVETVTSNNPLVAYYGDSGIVPLKEGNVEFTVKFAGIEETVKVPVEVKAAQKATAIKESGEAFKIQASDETQEVVLTVLDQYSEELRADAEVTVEVKDADGKVVDLGDSNPTIALAKVNTKLNVPAGNYTVAVKAGETVIGNVTVEAVAVAGEEIDEYEIVKAEDAKFEITVDESGEIIRTPVNVTINGYIDGVKVGTEAVKKTLTDKEESSVKFSAKAADEKVATAEFTSGNNTIAITPVAAGTTTIKLVKTEGDLVTVLATLDITVETKVPQVANLALVEGKEAVEATFNADTKAITFKYDNLTAGKDEEEKEIFKDYMIAEEGVTPIELVETKEGEEVTKITGRVIIKLKDDFGGGTYFFDFEATPELTDVGA